MPHVQVVGSCQVEKLAGPLSGLTEAAPPRILKVRDAYLSPARNHLLLEAFVVEGYLRQGFFLLIRQEEDGLLIRCHPFGAPQKTDGVKHLITLVAKKCIELCPGSRVGNTNLKDYL